MLSFVLRKKGSKGWELYNYLQKHCKAFLLYLSQGGRGFFPFRGGGDTPEFRLEKMETKLTAVPPLPPPPKTDLIVYVTKNKFTNLCFSFGVQSCIFEMDFTLGPILKYVCFVFDFMKSRLNVLYYWFQYQIRTIVIRFEIIRTGCEHSKWQGTPH